jgi:hypothetical protein
MRAHFVDRFDILRPDGRCDAPVRALPESNKELLISIEKSLPPVERRVIVVCQNKRCTGLS